MISSPSTRTEEAEDGEGHHPCRRSTLIYSLTQPTEEDRHCQRKSYPPLCLQHQRELYTKQRQIKDSQNSSSAIIMSGKIFYMYYTCLLLRHIFFFNSNEQYFMNFEVWVHVANVVMWLEYRDNRRGGGVLKLSINLLTCINIQHIDRYCIKRL